MSGSEVVPAPAQPAPGAADERAIGSLLVEAGKLSDQDVETILRAQREDGQRFGAVGMALGLLSQADIDYALSLQFDYTYLRRGESKVSDELVAAYEPFSPQVEALRALRAELMLRWFDDSPARKALAVVSEGGREGRSYIAANLAIVFAQLGGRTLLIDTDLRNSRQHLLFGLDNRVGLSTILSGRAGPEAIQRIPSLDNLSVLPAGALPPNPQELLTRPMFAHLLRELSTHVDMILLDSPPAAESADAQTLAMRAGAALVVVRRNASRMARLQHVSQSVTRAKGTVVGAVFNDF
jgi:chain length determinant protein tyrosine kinase EpsG